MQAYVCDSRPRCLVTSFEGYWKRGRTLASAQVETLSWGMNIQHETSKSKEWSESMTSTASAGFSAKGFGVSADISHTLASTITETASYSWSTTQTHEIAYEFTD